MFHKKVTVNTDDGRIDVTLDIEPDEYDPYAMLAAFDGNGEELARIKVSAAFKLTTSSANAWVANEFRKPA